MTHSQFQYSDPQLPKQRVEMERIPKGHKRKEARKSEEETRMLGNINPERQQRKEERTEKMFGNMNELEFQWKWIWEFGV